MNYPMRSIAFITELIHPPVAHQAADLQQLHSVAFADPECQYQNFQILPVGAQMANPPSKGGFSISSCTFLNDRIQVREEMTGISREDFERRLLKLAELSANNLKIPMFVVQQYVIRSLINPIHFRNSNEFVSKALLNMETDNFIPLDRNADILGLRLALSKPDQKDGLYNLRVESFSKDPRSLFIENIGTYRSMINMNNLQDLTANFGDTYMYIEHYVVPFLAQFDEAP